MASDGSGDCGHGADRLRGHYEAPTPLPLTRASSSRRLSPWIIVLLVAIPAVLVVGAISLPAWLVASSVSTGNRLAVEMDPFVAGQYPGYEVVQREPFTNYHGSDLPGNNYFLRKRTEPRLVLLVALVRPDSMTSAAATSLQLRQSGDYLTTDDVFSESAIARHGINRTLLEDVIARYVRAKPSPAALIVGSASELGDIRLDIAGAARYQRGLGYMSRLDATHVGLAKGDYGSSDGEIDYSVQPVGAASGGSPSP